MSYSKETVARLAAEGLLASYIEMDRELIAKLDAALAAGPSVEIDALGEGKVSLGHLFGRVEINVNRAPYSVIAWIVGSSDWSKDWDVTNFGATSTDERAQKQALAYARGALKGELIKLARETLQSARARLASLTADAH